jgi:acyl-CoA thioester hydrolase
MSARRWQPERLDRNRYPGPGMDLPVFYGDLDTNGHVNNVAFGRFFEHSRYTAHRSLDIGGLLAREGRQLLVARVSINYLAEAHFGQHLHVRTRTGSFGRASVAEEQAAWQGETCVALSDVVLVFAGDGTAQPVSDDLRALLATMSVGDDASDRAP